MHADIPLYSQVEGGDQKLLAGSLEFLKRNNVEDLIVEYGRGDEAAAAAMLGKLRDLGYVHQYVVGVEKWLTDEHRSKFPVESLCAPGVYQSTSPPPPPLQQQVVILSGTPSLRTGSDTTPITSGSVIPSCPPPSHQVCQRTRGRHRMRRH